MSDCPSKKFFSLSVTIISVFEKNGGSFKNFVIVCLARVDYNFFYGVPFERIIISGLLLEFLTAGASVAEATSSKVSAKFFLVDERRGLRYKIFLFNFGLS